MIIALTSASILFFSLYIIFSAHVYKKNEGRNFNLKNTFGYELFLSKKKEQWSLNILLFICLACVLATILTYTIKTYEPIKLMSCLLGIISIVLVGAVSIIPLSKYKEHMVCSIISMVTVALFCAVNLFSEVRIYKIEQNLIYIIPMVIDGLSTLAAFVCVLNPNVTNLNMQRDQEGNLIRPNKISLCLTEWIIFILLLLSLISICVVAKA